MLLDILSAPLSPFSSDPRRRLKKIQYRTIVVNLAFNIAVIATSIVVLFSTLLYFYRYTHLQRLVSDTKYNAKLRKLSDRIRFTESNIDTDYEDVEKVVDGIELNYPPVFGNTDVVILKAKMRPKHEADAIKLQNIKAGNASKPVSSNTKPEKREENDDNAEKPRRFSFFGNKWRSKPSSSQCRCMCSGLPLTVIPKSLVEEFRNNQKIDMKTTFNLKQDNRQVTVYQIDSCSLDRRDEVDYLINTITLLKHLQGVSGVPFLLDFFENRSANATTDGNASFIYATVGPFLSNQLQNIQFVNGGDALAALIGAIKSMNAVHQKNVVLLNASPKTIYVEQGQVFFEPPPAGLLMDSNREFILPRGMVLPKMEPPLIPGSQHTTNIDFALLLDTFQPLFTDKPIKERLKKAGQLLRDKEKVKARVKAESIIRMLDEGKIAAAKSENGINYRVTREVTLIPFVKDEQNKLADCTIPVYGYLLSSFHKRPETKPGQRKG